MGEAVRVAGGVVYRYGEHGLEVLVIDDVYGHVSLPKGHVELDEILEEAALREIAEETGILGRIVSPVVKVSYEDQTMGTDAVKKDAYYYLVEAIGGTLAPQLEEIRGTRFVDIAAILRLSAEQGYDSNQIVFETAVQMLQETDIGTSVLASLIDHTLLSAEATAAQVSRLCKEARAYQFAAVCINPIFVAQSAVALGGSPVKVATVIGFPLGATTTAAKVAEAQQALHDGAEELDMVIAIGKLLDGDISYVEQDIRAVVETCGDHAITKVILETALLTAEQQIAGAQCALRAGAHFVKTSTGFSAAGGATAEAVARLRDTVRDRLGVKASGGVRTAHDAHTMIVAGASRIGASAGPRLVTSALAHPW